MYNLIFGKRKKFEINAADVTHKVHYLGNVMTSIMKGDGCVDKAVNILWDNHVKHNGRAGIKMKLTLTQGGLQVETEASGVTEYYGHRIHYIIAHPLHPKLFVWVYQHVGKNLKTELRCHGVLCKHSRDAKLIALMLNDRLERTFAEYKREKKRMQTTRLCNFKNRGFSLVSGGSQQQMPMRTKSLSSTVKFYKPPIQRSMVGAPKLDDVQENVEEEEEEEAMNRQYQQSMINIVEEERDEEVEENDKITSNTSSGIDEDLIIDDNLIEALNHHYESTIEPAAVALNELVINSTLFHKQQPPTTEADSSSLYSNPCDSGIEESFTLNYEFGIDSEQQQQQKHEVVTSNPVEATVCHHSAFRNHADATSPTPSFPTVSYDYLGDTCPSSAPPAASTASPLLERRKPIIKQSRSFKAIKSPNSESNSPVLNIRNPFRRLHLSSSSFSNYSTYKRQQQQQQQRIAVIVD